jgi:hypothetical protein
MLVPKLIVAVKTLIPIDEVRTGGREHLAWSPKRSIVTL